MIAPCNNHHFGEEAGPVLSGPSDAARIVRLSVSPDDQQAIVLLLCGPDHRLLLAVTVAGAPISGVRRAVDLVLQVAESGGITGLVIGLVRRRGGRLSGEELAALAGLVHRCDQAGVDLLDVLVVGRRHWRSVWNLADLPAEGEDGES
ncbi:MAG: hypothetical protein M3314_04340 [Actinomycetota bacterium]|nr:hypothetical protein [Actinomycetota bacterium]